MYIELAGSHANEEKYTTTSQLLSSLIGARHPLDQKMKNAELVLMEGGAPLLGWCEDGEDGEGVRRRRAVPDEEGGSQSGGEGDVDTQSDSETETLSDEDLGESTSTGGWKTVIRCTHGCSV